MAPVLDRRTVLRGIGAAVALPWLDAMGPSALWADTSTAKKCESSGVPLRAQRQEHADWTPKAEGGPGELPTEPAATRRLSV